MNAAAYVSEARLGRAGREGRARWREALALRVNQAVALLLLVLLAPLLGCIAFLVWRRDGASGAWQVIARYSSFGEPPTASARALHDATR